MIYAIIMARYHINIIVLHSLEIFPNKTHIRAKLLQYLRLSFFQQQSTAGCCWRLSQSASSQMSHGLSF